MSLKSLTAWADGRRHGNKQMYMVRLDIDSKHRHAVLVGNRKCSAPALEG